MPSTRKTVDQIVADIEVGLRLGKDAGAGKLLRLLALSLVAIKALLILVGRNSRNSSKPPSQDPFRGKNKGKDSDDDSDQEGTDSSGGGDTKSGGSEKSSRGEAERKPGGQPGRKATFLEPVANPDRVKVIKIDRSKLPKGTYKSVGFEARQVVEVEVKKVVIEYQGELLEDEHGNIYRARFPSGVTCKAQYGNSVKVHAVYLSQFQFIPYERLSQYFRDICGISLSQGSILNFNKQASDRLEETDEQIKSKLAAEPVVHADETGVHVAGKNAWLHVVSSPNYVSLFTHEKRGGDAIVAMGILTGFTGVVVDDHWKAYFRLDSQHALCNAHHLRELTAAHEQYGQTWAKKMLKLLLSMNAAVHASNGSVTAADAKKWIGKYRKILRQGGEECPEPTARLPGITRGRLARSKPRSLLERLINFEKETLRFLTDPLVPFTNNRAEGDIRMTKVRQKISGCFRTMANGTISCRIRSFLLTAQRHGVSAAAALKSVFTGETHPSLAKLSS